MATSKRKGDTYDDFIFTIYSDDENAPPLPDEEIPLSPRKSNKKRKRESESSTATSKNKRNKSRKDVESEDDGSNEEEDGVFNPDFEFEDEGEQGREEFDASEWGFEGVKQTLSNGGDKAAVDIEEIITRRKEKRSEGNKSKSVEANQEDEENEDAGEDLQLADSGDEFMAEDGFGMGVESGVEEEETGNGDEDGAQDFGAEGQETGEGNSDDESVASPVPHPDDMAVNESSDEDDGEDLEEAARREAFFAPEEKPAKGNKTTTPASFQDMSLSRPILKGLATVNFTEPTPIQAKTIPFALRGKDIVAGAVTGSGKTAAFIVPILERLLYRPKKIPTSRVAILVPTRELAIQCHAVATKLASHTDIKFCLAVGGLSSKVQEAELKLRPDIIIATPGRFIDHMRNSASFAVNKLEILVLDEADRMLENGFADELNEILTTIPKGRQTMLFSATMTSSVDNLIRVGLNSPVRLLVDSQKQTVGTLVQEFIRLHAGRETKRMGYLLYLCKNVYKDRVIVFFRQKKEAHRARVIFALSDLKATELHGNMTQEQRNISLQAFRDGKASFLLATDVASRGLDIKRIDTVINYEAPQSHEIYLHRVGRTARAGRRGIACTIAAEPDRKVVKAVVKEGKKQGAKIRSKKVEAAEADKWAEKVEDMKDEIEEILAEEKEEKLLAQTELQVRKGENLILHEDEIKGRPKRTWFESERDKKTAKKVGQEELNGSNKLLQKLKKKGGKLSNKDKKKLDNRDARLGGRLWKKGRAEGGSKRVFERAKKEKKEKDGKGKKAKAKFGKRG